MIFPSIKSEAIVQVSDQTRIDCTKTFVSPDEAAITLLEIEAEGGSGFIDVTADKYLDWSYSTDGDKTPTVRVTTDGAPVTETLTFTVITKEDDLLFSVDADIISHETELYRFLREGRSTFLDIHRISQGLILDSLAQRNVTKRDGAPIEPKDIYNIKDFKEWSKFLTLSLIFESVMNESGDVFSIKATKYSSLAKSVADRAVLQLDSNQDGTPEAAYDLRSARIVRR